MGHGDYTGQQKVRLMRKKELAQKAAEAEGRLTTINQLKAQELSNEAVELIPEGYSDFASYRLGKLADQARIIAAQKEFRRKTFEQAGIPIPKELLPKSADDDEVEVTDVLEDEEDEYTVVEFRCTEDVEAVTLGHPSSTFDLHAGQVYRTCRWIRDHLAEKDLVQLF